MTAIRVVRQGKKGKTDRLPLYVEFYINREKIRIAVRLSVTSKEWDEQNEVIKGRDKESKDKNLIISNIRLDADLCQNRGKGGKHRRPQRVNEPHGKRLLFAPVYAFV